ncbi:hypothetical protein I302_103335 [Kwoniella bestiolae CBS 10118]|uniref:Uncharacterized protein n=1 Tax=Kwoniella bestiolae CBS 10118 TaxID=1296100 RepID=A0A1B9G848_9TREE|nr:hypothetical protein I302_02037 [Kwoniella bestiolae CBS 10118]OCF27199.1 hypothetical protein I302_02037 [Kwoniella bestiolae CBS 10118]
MPINVTPTPIHPHSLPPISYHRGCSPMPTTGPARVIDILPPKPHMPGSVLPNGLRNPWAPYSGETYIPASENVVAMQNHNQMGGGSIIAGGRSGRSMIAPSFAGSGMTLPREDDGWSGSLGRAHQAHAPDPSSVGAIGPTPVLGANGSQAGWMPASWGNHQRMTPTIASGLAHSEVYPASPSLGYNQPSPPRRRGSGGAPGVEGCEECQLGRSRSYSAGSRHHRKVSFSMGNNSPSPLRR